MDSVNCGDKETGIVSKVSIGEAGRDFLALLLRHFENDRPDVLQFEFVEAEED